MLETPKKAPVKDDPLAKVKAQLDSQMRCQVFERTSPVYEEEEFARATYVSISPWGNSQVYSGLAHGTHKGAHTPHGWGILEHHEGFLQVCSMWRDGIADGPGLWVNVREGQEQCGYGTWIDGKRDGYFSLVKEGGVYVEEYDMGELRRRIKWRKDKLHVKCTRCNALFVPSANTSETKLCRFHPERVNYEGIYPCCGARAVVNPRGCSNSMHVEPVQEDP